jgi:hypothetical protein
MKTPISLSLLATLGAIIGIASGCSSVGSKNVSPQELNQPGPTVVNPRVSPDVVKLNDRLQPLQQVQVYADVKDIQSPVTGVQLRFVEVPFEVQLRNIGGTTWQANISPDLLRKLAVGSQTVTYNANIYAEAQNGTVGVSKSPVQIKVSAPDLAAVRTG